MFPLARLQGSLLPDLYPSEIPRTAHTVPTVTSTPPLVRNTKLMHQAAAAGVISTMPGKGLVLPMGTRLPFTSKERPEAKLFFMADAEAGAGTAGRGISL